LTKAQSAALHSDTPIVVAEGGNQSGKSLTATVDACLYAINEHPVRKWPKDGHAPSIWYSTTSYELFAQQAWEHIKNLLLYKGESELHLPTMRLKYIGWDRVGVPKWIHLTNGAEIVVKAYAQGRSQFQAKTLDHAVVDEECEDEIWNELFARLFAADSPRIFVAATPLLGKQWLDNVRTAAFEGSKSISHFRFKTLDNPTCNASVIDLYRTQCKEDPDKLKLRLEGIPYFAQGLIYPDGIWTPEHVCAPFDIPKTWTRYSCVDPGYRSCGALWAAVSPPEINSIVIYRDYLGKERTISQNAEAVVLWEHRGQHCYRKWIDPAALGTDAESGEKVIDLWRFRGYDCQPAPDNRVISGIERCKELMIQRGGPKGDRPLLRVFNTCRNFIRERRGYRWNEERPKGDERNERPEKREDHVMDPFRYMVAAGLDYIPYRAPAVLCPDPKNNPVGYALWLQRHPQTTSNL